MYLGDFAEDATLYFCFNTFDNAGASIAPAVAGTVYVYKDKATDTEVETGVTVDNAYDTVVGVHNVEIVLTDAFYATGADYHVILKAATIDGQTVNAVLATFSIENRFAEVDMTKIHGTAITETSGQLAGAFTKFFDVATPTGTVNSLPDAVAGVAGGVFIAGTNAATSITTALTTNIIGDITGTLDTVTTCTTATTVTDRVTADVTYIHGTALTETSGQLAGAFTKFFDVATPTGTVDSIPDAVAGAAGGLFIAGSNAATSITTALTANITGNLSGSVGSVGVGGIVNATFGSDVGSTAYATNTIALAVRKALDEIKLDHLVAVADSDDPVNNSIVAKMAATAGDWSTFVDTTDSLQSARDKLTDIETDTGEIGTGGAGLDDLGGMATAMKAEVQAEATAALVAINLDHLMKVASENSATLPEVVDTSVLSYILTKTDGDTSDFDFTSDSLEAIADGAVSAAGYSCTLTIQNLAGDANIAGASVWMSTSTDGTSAYTASRTTDGSGQVTFWLATGTYYVFAIGGGYSYENDGGTTEKLTVSGVGKNGTYKLGTAISGNVGGASATAFLTRMADRIRKLTDEPSTNAKYSDAELYEFIHESYISVLQEVQRNQNTQIVAKYTFDYTAGTDMYALPATAGTILAIGEEDDTYGTKWFYEKGSHLSEYGTRVTLEGNFVKFQPLLITSGTTVTVWYLPSGCAKLFNAKATTITSTAITFTSLNLGTRDVRPDAYVGSMLRVMPDDTNTVEQERIITAQSGDTYEVYTVSPAFSPTPTSTTEFEICPAFPAAMDMVVATKVALRIVGIEGDTKRYKILTKEYSDAIRTLLLQTANKDFQQGSLRRGDGYQSPRGSRGTNPRPRRLM